MLYEYAVDPVLFGTFQDYKLWSERFGITRARVISAYPRRWKRLAIQNIQETGPVKRQTMVDGIRRLDEKGKLLYLREGSAYDGQRHWLDNAHKEHRSNPFQAIIAKENPQGYPDILLGEDVDEDTPGFHIEQGCIVERKAKAMADAVSLLLRASSRVIFIDPYFHPGESRFLKPLRAFIDHACRGKPLREIEYHLSHKYENSPPTDAFRKSCFWALPTIVPATVQFSLFRWLEKVPEKEHRNDGAQDMHPRYILTDIAGIRFDHGLDEGDPGQTTDVEIIADSIYKQRLSEYQEENGAFKLHDKTVINAPHS